MGTLWVRSQQTQIRVRQPSPVVARTVVYGGRQDSEVVSKPGVNFDERGKLAMNSMHQPTSECFSIVDRNAVAGGGWKGHERNSMHCRHQQFELSASPEVRGCIFSNWPQQLPEVGVSVPLHRDTWQAVC